jgi:hypothetical protein
MRGKRGIIPDDTRHAGRVRPFKAEVTFRSEDGQERSESFPVIVREYEHAKRLALAYAVNVLRLGGDFQLRVHGA